MATLNEPQKQLLKDVLKEIGFSDLDYYADQIVILCAYPEDVLTVIGFLKNARSFGRMEGFNVAVDHNNKMLLEMIGGKDGRSN